MSLPDAERLAESDPYQFQWWALGLVGARPVEEKKGADRGIDGRIYFHDEKKNAKTKQIIIQVKSGGVSSRQIRDLSGVLQRENAQIGVFITMLSPTREMRKEAASGGFYNSPWLNSKHPRLQILTIEEILNGRGIDYPLPKDTSVTFKKAKSAAIEKADQKKIFEE